MQQPIDLNSLSLIEAESLAYRETLKIQAAQQNLNILNQVIAAKSKEAAEVPKLKKSEKS